jgi:serine/threonine protein kinase
MTSNSQQQPAWLPPSCEFPLHETSALERSGRLTFDRKDEAAAAGAYGEVFPGTYIDDTGTTYRVCAKRDNHLSFIDLVAALGHQLFNDEELQTFYTRVSNDLLAAWRLLGDPRVVNYLAITTTTRKVASGTVVLPEYFIMEEEGEDLTKWLKAHPPCPENRAAFEGYVQCILEGLAALHSAGITHRDLKPGNVVICRHDASTAKIIDLGLAKTEIAVRAKAVNSMTDGTLWFEPPEFMDPLTASQAVDVWAVGVMCAEWLLGEQMESHEAARVQLVALSNSPDGMTAVWARLREAASQSRSPQSLLERVANAALVVHAAARPSSTDLAGAASVAMSPEGKQTAFKRWVGHATHVLRDCCAEAVDSDVRSVMLAFIADVDGIADPSQCTDRLIHLSGAITRSTQTTPMLLRVARNFLHSLLHYNTRPADEARLLALLGAVYVKTSSTLNYIRALALYDRVIEIHTAALGADHHHTGVALREKAGVLARMGRSRNLSAAVALYDRVIEITTTAWGADHPQTAVALHDKARALAEMGGTTNLTAAVSLFDRVIAIETAALGAGRLETAMTLHEKAGALLQMGGSANLSAAVALYDRVIEVNTAALGADHPQTAVALNDKARALAEMGGAMNLREASSLFDRVIEIKTASSGADHPQTALSIHAKAKVLVRMGGPVNLSAAVDMFDRAIAIDTAALGADHPETAVALHEKAGALLCMGGPMNLITAVSLYDRAFEIKAAALGIDHLETAATLHDKAYALVLMGGPLNLSEAVSLFDRVVDIEMASLGADHPRTAKTLRLRTSILLRMLSAQVP